ncbi:hypothetical protein GGS26DRAFT_603926 [Hypomontagnella submonticulosa]|nr:hypothetical protein GGS26DRAFT_603926 [Hypomontagnella submonticulosa]
MNRIESLQKEVYGDWDNRNSAPAAYPQRSRSLPAIKGQTWVAKEAEYVPGKKPQRSRSVFEPIPEIVPYCVAAIESIQRDYGADEDYDSDEEDRRNGVPVVVLEDRGREYNPLMKAKASHMIKKKLEEKHQLEERALPAKRRYLAACRWLSVTRGRDWDARMWSFFTNLERTHDDLANKIDELEFDLNELEAILLSFEISHASSNESPQINDTGGRSWFSPDDLFMSSCIIN